RAWVEWALVTALLAAGMAYRVILILRGWRALNSDEAVLGLMARHIAFHGELPLFVWGVQYEGAFESYVAAPFFALFGSSTAVLHLSAQLLVVAFLAAMYVLARAAYGRIAALLTLGWLAFGPLFAIKTETQTIGGYQEMLLLGALLLLGTWSRLREREPLPATRRAWVRCLATYVGIGACIGLGLWSSLLIAPAMLVALVALVAERRRELRQGGALALAAGALLFGAPDLIYQVTHAFPALAEGLQIGGAHFSPAALFVQVVTTLAVAVPTVLGSPKVCPGVPQGFSGPASCTLPNLGLSLAAVAVFVWAAWQCWVVLRPILRHAADAPAASEARAQVWLRGMLIVAAGMTLVTYMVSAQSAINPTSANRYLTPLFLSAPVLFGTLWEASAPGVRQAGELLRSRMAKAGRSASGASAYPWRSGPGAAAFASALLLALLLTLDVIGCVGAIAKPIDPQTLGLPAPGQDEQLIVYLEGHGVHTFYGDYWTVYRLVFESNERLIGAVRGANGAEGLQLVNNHYRPYIAVVARDPHPA
ncbi:MAG TPA: glycosyltransferase family 39 protein, partial [Ktedonobacterales bacterium]|nr:glycosyltransferase family 39 protein [Ktedonobacterales bacterium]